MGGGFEHLLTTPFLALIFSPTLRSWVYVLTSDEITDALMRGNGHFLVYLYFASTQLFSVQSMTSDMPLTVVRTADFFH
jgi:hypothetical protein